MGDRKYRHRGYQDSDHEERRPRAPYGERRPPGLEGGPRGRGLGSPQTVLFTCANCGQEVKAIGRIELDTACSGCGKPLHTCTNCSSFDPSERFECRKPVERRVEAKAKANDCPLYQPKSARDLRSAPPPTPDDARSAFDALFKKK